MNPRPGSLCRTDTEGLREVHAFAGESSLGRFFAQCTHLEQASVPAFARLEAELARLGAGPELLAAARRSAEDEVRHTWMMRALTEAFGGSCAPVEIETPESRTLLAIALENAREGCVGETYGAMQAAFQARKSSDPRVRATMAVVARDEARHAELAWDVDAFLRTLLTVEERHEVDAAREAAWASLEQLLRSEEPSADLREKGGLPSARAALELLAGAREVLSLAA